MKPWLLVALLCALVSPARAHMDMWLSLTPDGAVAQLPDRYQSTRIHLTFTRDAQARLEKLVFVAGGHETEVPACWLQRVPDGAREGLKLSGSWYHDLKRMPPYINLRFYAPSARPMDGDAPVLSFLFSLQDGQLLSVDEEGPSSPNGERRNRHHERPVGCPAT